MGPDCGVSSGFWNPFAAVIASRGRSVCCCIIRVARHLEVALLGTIRQDIIARRMLKGQETIVFIDVCFFYVFVAF